MHDYYNPIVRTFRRVRAALMDRGILARELIRPETPLEFVPPSARRELWEDLSRQGLRLPPLQLSPEDDRRNFWQVLESTISLALGLQRWSALLLAVPLTMLVRRISRRRAVHFPPGPRTLGELTIYATRFGEHTGSGYRWTRNEIALKVRLIIAESLALPLDEVRPEATFAELGVT